LELELKIPSDARAPATVRRSVEALSEHISRDLLDDLQLLADEVVTNGLLHAPEDNRWILVKVLAYPNPRLPIRVEVTDSGTGFEPKMREPDPEDTGGRGLFLVDALADRWGVDSHNGTRVWLELDQNEETISRGPSPAPHT
jgi:anti-sigma regulatory factor (Ser/Thr protein kinase)